MRRPKDLAPPKKRAGLSPAPALPVDDGVDPLARAVKALDRDTGSLVELLPYWEIQHGAVYLADSRAEVGFEVALPNREVMGEEALTLFHRGIKGLLRTLNDTQRLRILVRAAPLNLGEVLSEYRKGIDAKEAFLRFMGERVQEELKRWAQEGLLFSHRYYVSLPVGTPRLGYTTTTPFLAFLQDLIPIAKRRPYVGFTTEEYAEWLKSLEAYRAQLSLALGRAGLAHRPLGDGDLFGIIFEYLNPDLPAPKGYVPSPQHMPSRLPEPLREASRRATLRSKLVRSALDNRHLDRLRLGASELVFYKLVDVPDETWFGMMDALLEAAGHPAWLILDITRVPGSKAEGILRNRFRDYYVTAEQTDIPDIGAEEGAREVSEYIRYIRRSGDGLYLVSALLILSDRNPRRLEERLLEVQTAVTALEGHPFLRLHRGTLRHFLEGLPFSGYALSRPRLYPEVQAAHFWPTNGRWTYQAERPREIYLNRINHPVALDPWDQKLNNYNALIVGESGSGKSYLSQHRLTEALKSQEVVAVAIDRHEYSYAGLYEAMKEEGLAAKVVFGAGSPTVLNPFDLPPGQHEPDDSKLLQLEALFRQMLPPTGDHDPAIEEAILRGAILQTYRRRTLQKKGVGGNWERHYQGATISDLIASLNNLNAVTDRAPTPEEKTIAQSLAARLERWSRKTPLGKIFDGPTNVELDPQTRFLYIVVQDVEGLPHFFPVAMLNVIQLLWRFLIASPHPRRIAIIEEAWYLLQNPLSATTVYDLFRRGRTLGISTWAVSQNLNDFLREHAQAVASNISTYFVFPVQNSPEEVAKVLGCPLSFAALKETLTKSPRHYSEALVWLRKGEGGEGGVVRVLADPFRYWLFTTHPKERERREVLAREEGSVVRAASKLAGGTV